MKTFTLEKEEENMSLASAFSNDIWMQDRKTIQR